MSFSELFLECGGLTPLFFAEARFGACRFAALAFSSSRG
jgi:hypothetical protein